MSNRGAEFQASDCSFASIPWQSELETLARRYAGRIAVTDETGTLTYAQLHERAIVLAGMICGRFAAQEPAHRRVGVLLRNSRAAVVADYAVALAGCCIVHLNPAYSPADLDWCVALAPVDLLITEEALQQQANGIAVETWTLDPEGTVAWPEPKSASAAVPRAVDPCSEARVIFTSGSSGPPKAAVYSHRQRWMAATVLRSVLPYRPGASSGIALMTPYVHGASALARAYLDCGSRVEIMQGIDPERLREGLRARTFDAVFAPPSVLAKLAELFEFERFDHMRCIFTGTQPLTPGIYRKTVQIFGPCLRVTYGKTENLNPITVLDPQEVDTLYTQTSSPGGTCVGYPGPGVELRLTPSGEIELRSQHQFSGYLATSGFQPHAADAWHATGDLGEFDECGRLWLKGRNSDTINTGGYMVSPDEVEAKLSTVAAVTELTVFGVPSEYWTEVSVCAYVPARKSGTAETQLRSAAEELTKYKRPRLYVPFESLAKTPAGKVDRREIRRQLLSGFILVDGLYPSLKAKDS